MYIIFIDFIIIIECKVLFSCHSSSSHYSMFLGFLVNKLIHFCMLVFFSHFRKNVTKNAGMWWCRFLSNCTSIFGSFHHPFSGWLKKIPYLRSGVLGWSGDVLEPPSVVVSVCKTLYQKLVFCWNVYDIYAQIANS